LEGESLRKICKGRSNMPRVIFLQSIRGEGERERYTERDNDRKGEVFSSLHAKLMGFT